MTLRERIAYTRTIYKLSQTNVADALGVSRNYISMIENNNGNVGATQERLEEILNIIYKLGEEKKKGRLQDVLNDLKTINKNKNKEYKGR
ncbi:helix-turn-helix domain-containing protein [Clostridium taeniosporum]|uniref:XRE family transcriptional regulator n=1 Tax=Clostridium taeniosporum TaxID=394958 RepID=A0A1D7XKM7_9CLOT|nr:helix-turn-helix transcriptional regulator [Clostridium taeniosporum]AOR23891.1 XRE family transcriptional regulator [Clostridium taeniosporum]